jgi:ankyrin repeat protein
MSYEQKYLKYKQKYLDLKNKIGGSQEFINAIRAGNVELVRKKLTEKHGFWLTAHFADTKQTEKKTDLSALEIAVDIGNIEMVKLLIEYGADVKVINKRTNKNLVQSVIYKNVDDNGNFNVKFNDIKGFSGLLHLLILHGAPIYPDNFYKASLADQELYSHHLKNLSENLKLVANYNINVITKINIATISLDYNIKKEKEEKRL